MRAKAALLISSMLVYYFTSTLFDARKKHEYSFDINKDLTYSVYSDGKLIGTTTANKLDSLIINNNQ